MEQTSLNIGTIGQKLEAARLAKGVSVSEAGEATKILSKFIEAMESDDFGVLSAPVYAKSFIKMYALYLGLDARVLVEEYVAQHAPKTKVHLPEEVRQNLAKSDHLSGDAGDAVSSGATTNPGGTVFGDVNAAMVRLSGSGFSLKLLSIIGAIVLLGIIFFSLTQCADDETEVSAAGGAAMVERELISDGVPDAYLVGPGEVDLKK
jgi:hypothetical protein